MVLAAFPLLLENIRREDRLESEVIPIKDRDGRKEMSASYIAIKVITNDGKEFTAELSSGDTIIDVEVHDGTFSASGEDFESIIRCSDLFKKAYEWFYASLEDPACAHDETDEVIRIYGSGSIAEIMVIGKNDVSYASFFSREEYWDEPFGASLVSYDYRSKVLFEEHRDEIPYSDMDDCYGDELYEQFKQRQNNK